MKHQLTPPALTVFLLAGLCVFQFAAAFAAPGDLDTTFAGTGKTQIGFGLGNDSGRAVALQSDLKYVVVGSSANPEGLKTEFSVVRYNPNGSLDTSFGHGGKVLTPVGPSDDFANAVKIQTDGKIVVAGSSRRASGSFEMAVVRYQPDGSLDSSFGGDGIVTSANGAGDDVGRAIAIQTDGKIVVAGSSFNGSNDDFAVIRLNGDGSFDTSFDGDGKVTTAILSTGDDFGNAVAIQSDGKIVVAGRSFGQYVLVRYNTGGTLDTSWDGDGILTDIINKGISACNAMTIQPDGKIVVVASSVFTLGIARYNSDGSFDTSFNGSGRVFTQIGANNTVANSVAIQSGNGVSTPNKLVVAGYTSNGVNLDIMVVRYNLNGSLDTSFGGDGIVTTPIGAGDDAGFGLVIQGTGNQPRKITVAGTSHIGSTDDFAIVRYLADGSFDTSFDGDGIRTDDLGNSVATAKGVAIQTDGKIVVAGYRARSLLHNDFAAARFNSDGSLDTSFDGDGKAATAVGVNNDIGNAVAVQPNGKIVVAGSSSNDSNDDFALVRYNADGLLDPSFNLNGKVTTSIGAGNDVGNALALQVDGKIVVAGSSFNGSNDDFAVTRYNINGGIDTLFSFTGKVVTQIGAGNEEADAVAIQPDGKIVVAGFSRIGGTDDFAVVRYNTDGTLDSSFNGDGKVTTAIGVGSDHGKAVAIQADGKIIVAGSSFDDVSNNNFALVRYNPDGSLDSSFGSGGKVITVIGGHDDNANAIAIQADGRIVVAGSTSFGSTSAFAVVRYNANGSLDGSYGVGGKVVSNVSDGGSDAGYGVALDSLGRAVVAGEAGGLFGVVRVSGDPVGCSYALTPSSQFFTAAGGSGILNITTSASCNWTASASESWITFTSAGSGAGNEVVTYEVRDNFTANARQAFISVSGSNQLIVQDGGLGEDCGYSISPTFESFPAPGGGGVINVSASEHCAWQAVATANWITITSSSAGIGNSVVGYTVGANAGTMDRKGAINIGGQAFAVKQKGS